MVKLSSLGDVVHSLPAAIDMHTALPGIQIDWVVEEAFVSLVRLNPDVRDVIPFALRRWRKSLLKAETRAEMRAFWRRLREQRTHARVAGVTAGEAAGVYKPAQLHGRSG